MTTNPLHATLPQVFMVAVLRATDKTVVAAYSTARDVTKEGIRECVAGNPTLEPGKRYSIQGAAQTIHYQCDANGRVFSIVTNPQYPPRVAFQALEELQMEFADYGPKIPTATEELLSKPTRLIMKAVVDKYASPAATDKLTEVQGKIDVVSSVMKDNIQQILVNNEQLENIEAQSAALNEQAAAFQSQSNELTNKMWWKMWKMRLLIGGLIVVVLIIIIVPSAISAQQAQGATSSSSGN